jgi:hypothetical protein
MTSNYYVTPVCGCEKPNPKIKTESLHCIGKNMNLGLRVLFLMNYIEQNN